MSHLCRNWELLLLRKEACYKPMSSVSGQRSPALWESGVGRAGGGVGLGCEHALVDELCFSRLRPCCPNTVGRWSGSCSRPRGTSQLRALDQTLTLFFFSSSSREISGK